MQPDTAYSTFAKYYDSLTQNIDYKKRAAYFAALFEQFSLSPKQLLDLACGTARLTTELSTLGYDLIGVDSSAEMLLQARENAGERPIFFIQQEMQELTLHHAVDGVVCALDSINHLPTVGDVKSTFERVAQYLKSGGVFAFDVNTLYKHQQVLADSVFVFDTDEVFCIWRNEYSPYTHSVDILLDFFVPIDTAGEQYERQQEEFSEQYYSPDLLTKLLEEVGFRVVGIFHEDSTESPREDSERLVVVAQKIK